MMQSGNLKDKRLFLLDMDGTIYLDDTLFDGTLEFLDCVRRKGGRYLFLTNNSSKSVSAYVEKLVKLGIKAGADDFFTSVDATIMRFRSMPPYHKIYVFGTTSLKEQLLNARFPVTDRLEADIDCLLMGFDRELTFQKLEDACILLGRGVDYYATNPDWVCPTWYGYVPDCGSVCEMLFRATGKRPVVIGKPQPDMVLAAMEKTGFSKQQTLMIGDRLYTDIASGEQAGVDTVLVLSGESTLADVEQSKTRPTHIVADIKALLADL